MQAYKIDVRNLTEQQKKDVQEAFFEMGYKWRGGDAIHQELDKHFYFAEDHKILYCESADFFFNDKDCEGHKQITYTELMQLAGKEGNMSNNFTKGAFTKANLKDGMVVKQRGGSYIANKYQGLNLILNNHMVQADEWDSLDTLKYDLTAKDEDSKYFDIVEVYEVIEVKGSLKGIERWDLKSIWKRSEQTEQQKQLAELKAAQEQLLLQAKEIADKIVALQGS